VANIWDFKDVETEVETRVRKRCLSFHGRAPVDRVIPRSFRRGRGTPALRKRAPSMRRRCRPSQAEKSRYAE
jgi:hypothetical protein